MQFSYESTEDGTEMKPRESMELCVAILKLGGLFRTRDMPHRYSILYNVLQALILLLYYTFTLSLFVYLFVTWESFSDMIEAFAYSITLTVVGLKMNVIMFRSDEVEHIVKTVQENFFIHGTELSIENRKIIKNAMKLARKITITYVTLQSTVAVTFFLSPMFVFNVTLQTHNTTNISSETLVYNLKLPLQFWTPLDLTQIPQFGLAYTYWGLAGIICTLNLVGIESFCMTTFIYLTGQFELLCDSIRNASEKVTYRLDKRQRSSAGSNGINKRLEFTSDKKTKIEYSRENNDSVSSAKGKGNSMDLTHQSSLKHAPVHTFTSNFLRMFLQVHINTKFRSDILIFIIQVFAQFWGFGILAECLS
jgi:hypothetical protein